jgi:hypothetical protein
MMAAPIADAYWLIERQLLAGPYPGAADEDDARCKLEALLAAGIRSFIDLTEQVDPLEPYEPILRSLAEEMDIDVQYRRYAIRDMSVPTPELMATILDAIELEIAADRPVYVHCWGGIGRTGTVAACWLVGCGHTCDEALEKLKELRASIPGGWGDSPQTESQRKFVREWRREQSSRQSSVGKNDG